MAHGIRIYCDEIEKLASAQARMQYDIPSRIGKRKENVKGATFTKINQCPNEVIEYWHELCVVIIQAIANVPFAKLADPTK